jgi:glycosyltransferase involved in cell wall biosynthesis/peptidoglycan/xylan/chitin deacetylase (PgdA/CDA1 family)
MRILYCENLKTGSLATWSVHVYEVVTNLARQGHDVVLLNQDTPGPEDKLDMRQPSWQGSVKDFLFKSPLFRPFAGYITILLLVALEASIFISAFRLLAWRKPRFDVIYRRHNLFSSEHFLGKLFNTPSVREVNGLYCDELKVQKRGDKLSLWIIDRIERHSMGKADKIVVVTAKLKTVLHEEYGVPEDKIAVISNGANTDLFKPMDKLQARQELQLDPDRGYVCFVGHLVKWRHIENLIESAPSILKELPGTRFLIVGDGGLKEELMGLAASLGVADNFIFTGLVPYREVPLYINASDVCMLTSAPDLLNNRMGSSPLKLHEYMACGKPVIAGDIEGDTRELVDSGSGLVIDPTDIQQIAGAVVTLLKNEPMRQEMGERARRLVVEKYGWYNNAIKVAEVCRSVARPELPGAGTESTRTRGSATRFRKRGEAMRQGMKFHIVSVAVVAVVAAALLISRAGKEAGTSAGKETSSPPGIASTASPPGQAQLTTGAPPPAGPSTAPAQPPASPATLVMPLAESPFSPMAVKKVIIRNDDVGMGGPVSASLKWFTDLVMENDIKVVYAVVPAPIQDRPDFIAYLSGLDRDHFEMGTHGYAHESFEELTYEEQYELLKKATGLMTAYFSAAPLSFLPPSQSANVETTQVLKELGYHTLASSRFYTAAFVETGFAVNDFWWETGWSPTTFNTYKEFVRTFEDFYSNGKSFSPNDFFVIQCHSISWEDESGRLITAVTDDFERSIKYLKTKDVEFMTIEEGYEWTMDSPGIVVGKRGEGSFFIDLAGSTYGHTVRFRSPPGWSGLKLIKDVRAQQEFQLSGDNIEFEGTAGHEYVIEKAG